MNKKRDPIKEQKNNEIKIKINKAKIKLNKLVTIQIGKKGLLENQIQNINEILNKYKHIKIKFLKSFIKQYNKQEQKELAKYISNLFKSKYKFIGFTLYLYKDNHLRYKYKIKK